MRPNRPSIDYLTIILLDAIYERERDLDRERRLDRERESSLVLLPLYSRESSLVLRPLYTPGVGSCGRFVME